jgi:hypothetical protein
MGSQVLLFFEELDETIIPVAGGDPKTEPPRGKSFQRLAQPPSWENDVGSTGKLPLTFGGNAPPRNPHIREESPAVNELPSARTFVHLFFDQSPLLAAWWQGSKKLPEERFNPTLW